MAEQRDFDRLMDALRDGTGRVELDLVKTQVATTPQLASEFSEIAMKARRAGERVAFLYSHEHDAKLAPQPPRFTCSAGVTGDQAVALRRAGAKWIGIEFYDPMPAKE